MGSYLATPQSDKQGLYQDSPWEITQLGSTPQLDKQWLYYTYSLQEFLL